MGDLHTIVTDPENDPAGALICKKFAMFIELRRILNV